MIEKILNEIHRLKKELDGYSASEGLDYIESYINTLLQSISSSPEMKEVDLEINIQDYINSHFTERCDGGMISDWYKVLDGVHYKDLKEIAKHFFELGLKVQKENKL